MNFSVLKIHSGMKDTFSPFEWLVFRLPGMMTIAPDNLTVAMVQFNKLITFDLSDVKTFNIIENCFTSAISHIDYDPTSNTVAISGDK